MQKSAIALLVILLVVASTFGYYYDASQSSIASTKSQIDRLESDQSSSNSTITSEESQIESLQSRAEASSALHQVVFVQNNSCSSASGALLYAYPWGVELGNITKTDPSNATFEQEASLLYFAAATSNETSITFSLSDGIYYYAFLPWGAFFNPHTEALNDTGSVKVDGVNVTIIVTPHCPAENSAG